MTYLGKMRFTEESAVEGMSQQAIPMLGILISWNGFWQHKGNMLIMFMLTMEYLVSQTFLDLFYIN